MGILVFYLDALDARRPACNLRKTNSALRRNGGDANIITYKTCTILIWLHCTTLIYVRALANENENYLPNLKI